MSASGQLHVAIVGAGIAGLATAYRLGQRGHRVTVLETQERIGGRALTLHSRFAAGLVAQAGPTRFPADLRRVRAYAEEFGLELVPYYPASGTVVAYLRGKRTADHQPSPDEFWGYVSLARRYPRPLEKFALRMALAARALAHRLTGRRPWQTVGIRGGTERLAEALARASGAEFRLNTTVRSFKQDRWGVELLSEGPQGERALEADLAVCALPLSELPGIAFSPPISEEKQALSREIRFSTTTRIFLQMKRAYWRDAGHNGFAVTDTVGEVWDPHFDRPDRPALLVCYARDGLAARLSALDERAMVDYAVRELEHVFPGAARNFERGAAFCWNRQSWIRGGWPHVRAGFARRAQEFRRSEDRLYFAGDYASTPAYLNTVEGAIESGEYAALAIESAARLGVRTERPASAVPSRRSA